MNTWPFRRLETRGAWLAMRSRIFNTVALLSASLTACTAIALVLSFGVDDRRSYVSPTPTFNVGILDGGIDFFSDRGDRWANAHDSRTADRDVRWHNLLFYYRYVRWSPIGPTVWLLRVPLLWPLTAFAVLWAIVARLKRRAEKPTVAKVPQPQSELSRRIFNTLSLISALLLTCTVVSWVRSYWTDPTKDCVSFSDDFHVTVHDGRVSFFNLKDSGPYCGSIISLAGTRLPVERGCGDTAGIYYRYFRWADGAVLWTVSVSLFYPLIVFAGLPLVWSWKWWRRRRLHATQLVGQAPRA
jgi:hypothetical protein